MMTPHGASPTLMASTWFFAVSKGAGKDQRED